MAKGEYLGDFEHLVLLAVLRLAGEAYGMEVRREIEDRAERDASIGAVYATLDRLESKGLVRSVAREAEGERKPRRLYRVTAEGKKALERTHAALERMREGLTRA